jgi:hypothetical protein
MKLSTKYVKTLVKTQLKYIYKIILIQQEKSQNRRLLENCSTILFKYNPIKQQNTKNDRYKYG